MLPEYIAVRFNLHIRYVHKGILLGTGPLVDPGFFGRLLIPLHNLTDNNYVLEGGKGIIWVEFTKVSQNVFWNQLENKNRPSDLKSFPDTKDLISAGDYFRRSGIVSGIPDKDGVQSAFKGALDHAKKDAMDAKKNAEDAHTEVEQFNKQFRKFGWIAIVIGGITILLTILGIWLTGHTLISDTVDRVQDSRNEIVSSTIEAQDDKLKKLESEIKNLRAHLRDISELVSELKSQMNKLDDTGIQEQASPLHHQDQ